MTRAYEHVDDERLAKILDGDSLPRFMWDLAKTLDVDRIGARANADNAATHIEEMIATAWVDTQKIERLEMSLDDGGTAYTALSEAFNEIMAERDALLEQVATFTRTGPLQLIFRVEGDVHVTSPSGSVVVESPLWQTGSSDDPGLETNSEERE